MLPCVVHAYNTNFIKKKVSELLNSYFPIGLPGHNQTLPGPGPGWARATDSGYLRKIAAHRYNFTTLCKMVSERDREREFCKEYKTAGKQQFHLNL